jgi:acetyl-CoA carboxylase biotin carboxyl carrier protein
MAKSSIDKQLIRELASLLDETGLTEIEWKHADGHVRVARTVTMAAPAAAAPAPAAGAAPAQPAAATEADLSSHAGAVVSPMVGTVYVASEPGAAPFVKVGDTVSEGQTLMIVEAMKTMNPIPAPRSGKVTQVLVTNEQPVEFGQALLIVE